MTQPRQPFGGIVHTYLKYDPVKFPSPLAPPPDIVSPLVEHMLAYGRFRQLTEEELARAIPLDASQFRQLGPSLDWIRSLLEERRRRILATYETDSVQQLAGRVFHEMADEVEMPSRLGPAYEEAVLEEQLSDLERIWYAIGDDQSRVASQLVVLIERLGDKYQVDELAAKYTFTGKTPLTVPQALAIKEELEKIDELLKQVDEAAKTARIAVLDMESLAQFVPESELQSLDEIKRTIDNYVRELAERQGLERDGREFRLTPQAYRVFQGKLLARIFSDLQAARTGRHQDNVIGEGAVEMAATKPYEFGDSLAHMDLPQTLINAMLRDGTQLPIRLRSEDIVVHRTRNTPKCATSVIMDMSGSMRYEGQYINVKRMALALDGLVRAEYPGDHLSFIEMYTFAQPCRPGEIIDLMPRPVTLYDPLVRMSVDMSRPEISEHMVHPHFTNIQHSLRLARQMLAAQPTPNRQIILITDGLPTAHFEGTRLMLLYPPHPQTEQATMREGQLCQRDGITINIFLVPSWSQTEDDIRFAYRLAESTAGRVFFSAGRDLDRFVVWDYVQRKRDILG